VSPRTFRRTVRVAVFLGCLAPLAVLLADLSGGRLGAEPIRAAELRTGIWALTLLVVTLAITPLRRLTGWNVLGGYRRMLGLFAFTYVCLHFLTWFGVDQFFALAYIGKDIVKRPYITVGFASFLLMIPLAITSTNKMMRRLGRRWQQLHRLVYVTAAFGVWHYYWQVKRDVREPLVYAAILAVLLGFRVVQRRRARAALTSKSGSATTPGRT